MGHCKQTRKIFPDIFWPQCNTNPNATFKILPRNSEAMDIVGPASNRSITPSSLCINQSTHSWNEVFSNLNLTIQGQGHEWERRSHSWHSIQWMYFYSFYVKQISYFGDITNTILEHEKQSEFLNEIGKVFSAEFLQNFVRSEAGLWNIDVSGFIIIWWLVFNLRWGQSTLFPTWEAGNMTFKVTNMAVNAIFHTYLLFMWSLKGID